MNKFIKFSAKEEYVTPLCDVLDYDLSILCSSLTFGNTGEAGSTMTDNDQNTYDL